ncbi:zf-TFIIB domain-containing protein [Solirubrobacter ginsenosidimutans]|uniref:Zf-TFIIB domain-containing protein n=1 Tax=Solirubrobacter ginsenosidimutans TaxID=490573 RepID=A0A9X3MUR4_9ACTN|nr:zf-TFIIB domain-containing protein [Solirubrobacter ginsenosidimutans]MDA0162999.1 zf-TFIIB domain-containing protein [Solirubrobacter ginsenosidimutans]
MSAQGPCPNCSGQLVGIERSGVHIDACRNCRGVWLDRGELDQILERERRAVATHDDDDAEFFREMTGGSGGGHGSKPKHESYGFDKKTAERLLGDFQSHQKHKKTRKKSMLDDLFG